MVSLLSISLLTRVVNGIQVTAACLFLCESTPTSKYPAGTCFSFLAALFFIRWLPPASIVGVIIAAIVILFTRWYVADAIVAIVIGGIILWGAARIVNESVDILLEAAPKHIETAKVIDFIRNVAGVDEVHDIHIWTITSNMYALSAHLVIDDQMVSRSVEIVTTVRQEIAQRFNISHTTLQSNARAVRLELSAR